MKGENILTAEQLLIFSVSDEEVIKSSVKKSQKRYYSIAEAAPLISSDLDGMNLYFFMRKMDMIHRNGFPNKQYSKDGLLKGTKLGTNDYDTFITEAGLDCVRKRYSNRPHGWAD